MIQEHTIPPFCRWSVRASGEFCVLSEDGQVLGPNSAADRVFVMETAEKEFTINVVADEDTVLSWAANVRPSPFEKNSGVAVTVQQPVTEPTIQEMIRMYIREVTDSEDRPETPDEFFDFDMDDDEGELMYSQYEYDEMQEEYLMEPEETPPPGERSEATRPEGTDNTEPREVAESPPG